MTTNALVQIALFAALVTLTVKPLGSYMAAVFQGERTLLSPVLAPVERAFYRLSGIRSEVEQHWTGYALAMLAFSVAGFLLLYAIMRLQAYLPFNPQQLANVPPDLAFNTAVSFITNTNWQSYSGESTLSYFSQMVGLTTHNFVSAATGMALAIALIRGFARRSATTVGNFWVDLTRATLYVLLPLALVMAVVLIWQGVPQNFASYTLATGLEGIKQTIAQGPVASQEAIKMLGTNGGGFFNANSAHPFENPTPFSNFLQILSIFIIPAGLTYTLGRMTGSPGHGWAVLAAMFVLFAAGFTVVYWAESQPHPLIHNAAQTGTASAPAGNMEGKEVRNGIAASSLFATITTDASCGAVNGMHDSFTPLGGMVVLTNIMLGEVVFGGVGSGLYGILIMVVLSVFIAGLMVGRTPEYLGKKIEAYDVKMSMLYVLIFPFIILSLTAAFVMAPTIGLSSLNNQGPHGLTEILYAFTSGAGNNGSAFAGLNANTWWYNVAIGWDMLFGRLFMMIPVLALAGSLAQKKSVPPSPGTFPVNGSLFTVLLIGVILILSALTFFPALSLGPILEHLLLKTGQLF